MNPEKADMSTVEGMLTMTIDLTETQVRALPYKGLISNSLWQRLTNRIVDDHAHADVDKDLAERIMNEALGFLSLCAQKPEESFGPSKLVDIGWHTFILYTKEYAAFCQQIAGRFIHHNPNDEQDTERQPSGLDETVTALRELGPVDEMLWVKTGDCIEPGCDPQCNLW